MSKSSSWRSAAAVNWLLIAALITAAFLGSYEYFAPSKENAAESGESAGGSDGTATTAAAVAAFSSAEPGTCLTWDISADSPVSNFQEVTCDKEHRFEVSAREDLSTYPTSEFGPSATRPELNRQDQLRDELCQSSTLTYLKSKWDPSGKFDIASILPPQGEWDEGDRTLLCGLQTTDDKGVPQLSTGNVAAVDQSILASPGQCRAIGEDQVVRTVDCSQPHQLETVSTVNLAEKYPEGYPGSEELDKYLGQTCTAAATEYLGNEENLYQSTLQPFWGSLSEGSWNGGSRSVNCSLVHSNENGFSTITGSAKGGRDALNIDGKAPEERPARDPIREPAR